MILKSFISIVSIVATGAMLIGCDSGSKSNNNKLTPNGANEKPNYYSDVELMSVASQTSSELGVSINVASTKDYTNEYKYKRVLSLLSKNKSTIVPYLNDVEVIYISGSYGITDNKGKYRLSVDYDTDEKHLIEFFTQSIDEQKEYNYTQKELHSKLNVSIEDSIGLHGAQVSTVSNILAQLARDVDFKQDKTFSVLVLGNTFALTNDGFIINIGADYSVILEQVKAALEARITWNFEIVPLLRNLNLNLTFQPGIFDGNELWNVMFNLKRDASTIKTLALRFSKFYVGKRWDADYNNAILLMDTADTGAKLKEKLLSLNPTQIVVDYAESILNIKEVLKKQKITSVEEVLIDMLGSVENLNLINSFTADVLPYLEANLINQLNIKVLHLNDKETRLITGTQVLVIKLPVNAKDLNSILKQEIVKANYLQLKQQINIKAEILKVIVNFPSSMTASLTSVADLTGFATWFETLSLDTVKQTGLVSINLVYDNENNPTRFKDSILTINFLDFKAEKMKDILKPKTP